MIPVEMPKANENLTEATLERWLVREGQTVRKDQPLCEIITDKAKFELPSPYEGTVLKLLGEERAMLPVGYVLCVLGTGGDAAFSSAPELLESFAEKNAGLLKAHRGAVAALSPSAEASANVAAAAGNAVRATPAARRLAKEHGVDLAAVAAKFALKAPVGEKDVLRYLGNG